MNVEVIRAEQKHKPVLRQLLELYDHDFSEFTKEDGNEHGFYNIAGFVLVSFWRDAYRISEFFVMRKYRRMNVGNIAAKLTFDLFKGEWSVKVLNVNKPALPFWRKVINEYTNGKYTCNSEPAEDWDGIGYNFQSNP